MAATEGGHWHMFIELQKPEESLESNECAEDVAHVECATLVLQLFAQQPTLDFNLVEVGTSKTLYLNAENPTLLNQHLAADKVPVKEGFSLSEDPRLPGAASLNWSRSIAPHGSIQLPVTWQPTAPGVMSKLLCFKLDGKHRLQVKLLGKAVVKVRQAKQHGDQSMRQSIARTGSGMDAATAKPARTAVVKAAAGTAFSHKSEKEYVAVPPAGLQTTKAVAATAAGNIEEQAKFKVPPKRAVKSTGGLRLKAPSAPGARTVPRADSSAGSVGMTAAPIRHRSGLESSKSEAEISSPPVSIVAGRLTQELSSPALLGSGTAAYSISGRSGKGAINRSGRPLSGSSTSTSSVKVPSSARKTFKFFHTELWMNKQDRAFTGWLNYLLLPFTPEYLRAASEGDTSAALSDLRLASRVQGAMLSCYRSDPELWNTMLKIESAIDDHKLQMKPEVVLFEDLVQRQQALRLLLGYNPFWLSLAVEVITHKPFKPQESPADAPGTPGLKRQQGYAECMKSFLLREVLSDPDMVAELEAGKGAAHFNKKEYLHELGALVLKRFLLLVMLLDRAATSLSTALRTPLLFRLDAPVKESSQVVFEFLHGRLVGEGGLMKHLQHLGYKLSYTQSPLMEYPFAVSNLAIDLRDGLRLIKVAEVLTGDDSLLSRSRFPADRRALQIYNTSMALTALKEAGVPLSHLPTSHGLVALKPDDIVDGDREKTLSLLWAVARTLQLGVVLRVNTLKAEVQRVLAYTRHMGVRPLLTAVTGIQGRLQDRNTQQMPLQVYLQDELLSTLMDWVQAVCKSYGVVVRNFTSCFADGVVLCLLVHYYLPGAVDLSGVYLTKQRKQELMGSEQRLPDHAAVAVAGSQAAYTANVDCWRQGVNGHQPGDQVWEGPHDSSTDCSTSDAPWAKGWRAEFDFSQMEDPVLEDNRGIAANFKVVHRAANALGAVPEMLSSKDHVEHGPDERAVILYTAFLCSRLLDCSKDDRAAHIIQRAWRQYKSKSSGMARAHLNSWVAAATVIQRGVKAWLLRRRLEELLQQHRAAAVILQSAWRGRYARIRQQQCLQACVVLQRSWRRLLTQRQQRQQEAAALIQRYWRSYRQRKWDAWMASFLQSCLQACWALQHARQQRVLAATKLQATWRMVLTCRQTASSISAVTSLQAVWRGRLESSGYRQKRAAAVTIQAAWRGHQQRQQFARTRAAAVTLQAAYQGLKVRTAIKQSHAFAVFLQSCCKCRRDRAAFLQLRQAAILLQAGCRGWQERRRMHEHREACIFVQAVLRGKQVRHSLLQQHNAATCIQSAWRSSRARLAYKQQTAAASCIQTAWRATSSRQEYKQQLAAAVTLQSICRGQQVRAEVKQMAAAATVIAAAWRAKAAALHRAEQVKSIVQLQALTRRYLALSTYQRYRSAAVVLQSLRRGWSVRHAMQQQEQATVLIQSCWRAHVQQQLFIDTKLAAVSLQSAVRSQQARVQYQALLESAVMLQSSCRAWRCRIQLMQHKAAACIQAHWRRCIAQKQFNQAVQAAVIIQSCWRCRVQLQMRSRAVAAAVVVQTAVRSQQARCRFLAASASAVTLQSSWRARRGRQLLQQHRAARTIQCFWKRWKAMQQLSRANKAATRVQAWFRSYQAQRKYHQLLKAAVALQALTRGRSAARGWQARLQAACTLQCSWRAYTARALLQQHKAAASIQAHVRGWLVRRHVSQMAAAATAISAAWRCHKQQVQYRSACAAIVTLQGQIRTSQVKRQTAQLQSAAVMLQICWRGLQCRWQYNMKHASAIAVQAAYRGYKQRMQFMQQVDAAIALQAVVRTRHVHKQVVRWNAAATSLQAAYKGYAVRRLCQQRQQAAVVIQAAWKGLGQRRSYQLILQATTMAQAAWRAHQAAASYQQLCHAALIVQAAARGQQTRGKLRLQQLSAAAVTCQSMWRGVRVRQMAARREAAAIAIQRYARGMAGRKRAKAKRDYLRSAKELQNMLLMLHTRSRAATTIAATWRGYRQRQIFLPIWQAHQRAKAATTLQQAWRCSQAMSLLSKLRDELPRRRARAAWQQVIKAAQCAMWQQQLQAAAKEAAILQIQSAFRGWLVRRGVHRQIAGITRLQALWRGYKVRKGCGRASRDARRRIAAAVSAPPRRTIGVRTREALDVLLASKQCSQVISAVAAIEFSTRYSKACCQLMVDSEGVRALLEFMRSCNRSKPHMEMLGHALACLANICRWPDVLPGVLHVPDCVMVLSERLQMFRDTEDIFMATVGILSLLVGSEEGALMVAQSAPTAVKLWEQINLLLQRKMEMERKYIERLEGQKGSDVTAREATRKLVSAATQVDALQHVIERVDNTAIIHGIQLIRHQTKQQLAAPDVTGEELVPRSAHVVVQPNLWQPKNTIVRGTFRETVATRASGAAAVAAAGKYVNGNGEAGDVAAMQCLMSDQNKCDQLRNKKMP